MRRENSVSAFLHAQRPIKAKSDVLPSLLQPAVNEISSIAMSPR